MSRIRVRLSAAASALAFAALLAACSSPAPSGGADPGTGGDAPAAAGDFCAEFEANGGTGATIGPLQTWLVKEDLLPDVQGRVDAMGDITPPADIATEWDIMKTYYVDLLAAVEALPAGGHLSGEGIKAPEEYQVVTDYFFETC
ncbi:MAG: hypothetical protein ABI566_03830 [Pseudolysinimonas sp.]